MALIDDLLYEALVESDVPTLAERIGRPSWMNRGACLDRPDVHFFIDRGEDISPAKAVCAGCDVRQQCLEFAMAEHIGYGVWGGTSYRERKRLRRAA